MGELGHNEKELHYEVGTYLPHPGQTWVIAVDELAKEIIRGIEDAGSRIETHWFATKDDLIPHLGELIKEGDNVLVKASNSLGFSGIVQALQGAVGDSTKENRPWIIRFSSLIWTAH